MQVRPFAASGRDPALSPAREADRQISSRNLPAMLDEQQGLADRHQPGQQRNEPADGADPERVISRALCRENRPTTTSSTNRATLGSDLSLIETITGTQ